MSDSASLLVLTKIKFYALIDKGVLSCEILEGVKIVDKERQEQNLDESRSRSTIDRIDTVEAGEGEEKTKKNEEEVDKSHV